MPRRLVVVVTVVLTMVLPVVGPSPARSAPVAAGPPALAGPDRSASAAAGPATGGVLR